MPELCLWEKLGNIWAKLYINLFCPNSVMKTLLIFGLIAILLFFGCTTSNKNSVTGPNMPDNKNSMMEKNTSNNSMMNNGSAVKNDSPGDSMKANFSKDKLTEADEFTGQLIAGKNTPYLRYTEDDFNLARNEGKTIYLYFYATWCPTCAAERPTIFSAFNKMNYGDVVGFEVHYKDDQSNNEDNAAIQKFQIPYQHSTVILNSKGNVAYKSLSPISEDEIMNQISKARMN